jgi:phage prohead protease, HK97 family
MRLRNKEIVYEILLETKSFDDKSGSFEGYLSLYGNEDRQHDIVEKGAWSIESKPLPILYRHNRDDLLGGVEELIDDDRGLFVRGQLNLDVARAREVYSLMKQGLIRGLSPGYNETKDTYTGNVRHILSANLQEISLTPFPANIEATITSYKEAGEDLEVEAEEQTTHGKKEVPVVTDEAAEVVEVPAKAPPVIEEIAAEKPTEEIKVEPVEPVAPVATEKPAEEPVIAAEPVVTETVNPVEPVEPDNSKIIEAEQNFRLDLEKFTESVENLNELLKTKTAEIPVEQHPV